jgi:mono/diheme cytochrome c family protein
MRSSWVRFSMTAAPVLGCLLLSSMPVSAQMRVDFGEREYRSNCAICHGLTGKGDGHLYAAGFLAVKPSDLTLLSKANGGVFPFQRVYETIDGRQLAKAHGTADMPIWGSAYRAESAPVGLYNPEAYVQARILSLAEYLARIQAK